MKTLRNISVLVMALAFCGNAYATALSAARVTDCRYTGQSKRYLMKASDTIYAGGLVMVNSSGTAEPAAASASNAGVVGVAQTTVTAAASGSYYITVTSGVLCKFAGTTLGQDDVGDVVYAEDDQTVDETAGSNEPVAGVLLQYVSASEGWVLIDAGINTGRTNVVDDPLTLTGDLTAGGGAGAVTFSDSASSIVVPDDDSTALLVGSTGLLNGMTYDSTDDAENVAFATGVVMNTVSVTGATTLDKSDCGKTMMVTAGIDAASITLPATVDGCRLEFMYVGADGGALLDISPNASDAVHGSCTLAASVVEFSGTDDADIGLTKATANTGDTITLMGDGTEGWYVLACAGIWANN
jgi:hypothetical protein